MHKTVLVSGLAIAWLALTGARPVPPAPKEVVDSSPPAVAASLALGFLPTGPAGSPVLLLPTDPDAPPRVRVKAPRGAVDDETRQWLLRSRPAGVILSLPLPDARESLPVILPDAE